MKPSRVPFLVALAIAASALAAEARAQETEAVSDLRLNGFGTLGVVDTSVSQPWGFRRDAGQPYHDGGTRLDTDSRLGLQANYAVSPTIDLVGQVQLKRRVASSTPLDSLEWAFVAWRPTPELTVRVGRTGPDFFLLSDYRSVGFAYPWVRPNVETYGLLPIFSVNGADIVRAWDDGDVRWRVRAMAGQGETRVPGPATYGDLHFRYKLVGAVLSRESCGLLLRATLAQARGGIGSFQGKDALRGGLEAAQQLPVTSIAAEARQLADRLDPDTAPLTYVAFGAAYEHERWLLSAELVRALSRLSYADAVTGYVSLGRRIGPTVVYAMAGAAHSFHGLPPEPQWAAPLTPLVGAAAAAQFQAVGSGAVQSLNSKVDQHSLSFGMRWDVLPQVALKLQWDHYWIGANGSALWGNRTVDAARAQVATVALDFLF